MNSNPYYTRTWTLRRYSKGPISSHISPFSEFLAKQGYPYGTGQRYVREVGRLSKWLDQRGISIEELNEKVIKRYCRFRKQSMNSGFKNGPYSQILRYLRQNNLIQEPKSENSPIEECLLRYKEHLVKNKGLTNETIRGRIRIARYFLIFKFGNGNLEFPKITPQDIEYFLLDRSSQHKGLGIKIVTSALRCFFRFLQFRGEIPTALADSVPTIPSWRHSGIPQFLSAEDICRLIQSCKCNTSQGLRNIAIILLLSRLGLRAIEICRLSLDDIDWHGGFITVFGKNGKRDRLPLLFDVGEAISVYLRYGRPQCSTRYVFVRCVAPFAAFASSCAIGNIVRHTLFSAGLNPARKGSHLLRRSLATSMLQEGASLSEIGQILRHQKADTTAIYAKIDFDRLYSIAHPWPEGGGK